MEDSEVQALILRTLDGLNAETLQLKGWRERRKAARWPGRGEWCDCGLCLRRVDGCRAQYAKADKWCACRALPSVGTVPNLRGQGMADRMTRSLSDRQIGGRRPLSPAREGRRARRSDGPIQSRHSSTGAGS